MNEEDLERLGTEAAMDEGVALALDRFDMAWNPYLPVRLEWLTNELADALLLHDSEELLVIGSQMEPETINQIESIFLGVSILMSGYEDLLEQGNEPDGRRERTPGE